VKIRLFAEKNDYRLTDEFFLVWIATVKNSKNHGQKYLPGKITSAFTILIASSKLHPYI